MHAPRFAAVSAICVMAAPFVASAAQRPASVIVSIGDVIAGPNGGTVAGIQQATYDGSGNAGFMGLYTGDVPFYFVNNAPIFLASTVANPAISKTTVANDVSGLGNGGLFAIQVALKTPADASALNGIYSGNGSGTTVVRSGDNFTGLTLNSIQRPQADSTGNVFFYSTITATGTPRGIFRAAYNGSGYDASRLIYAGDAVSGGGSLTTVTTTGVSNAYDVSTDGTKFVSQATINTSITASATAKLAVIKGTVTPSTTPQAVSYIGSSISGAGSELWFSLGSSAINNSGTVATIGTSDASGGTLVGRKDVLTIDNTVGLAESAVVDGVTLVAAKTVSINNSGNVLSLWDVNDGLSTKEALLLGNALDLSASSVILAVNDILDTNGDLVGDYVVNDIFENVSGAQNLQLPDNGQLYVRVTMTPVGGGSSVTSMIAIPEPASLALLGLGALALGRRRRV